MVPLILASFEEQGCSWWDESDRFGRRRTKQCPLSLHSIDPLQLFRTGCHARPKTKHAWSHAAVVGGAKQVLRKPWRSGNPSHRRTADHLTRIAAFGLGGTFGMSGSADLWQRATAPCQGAGKNSKIMACCWTPSARR